MNIGSNVEKLSGGGIQNTKAEIITIIRSLLKVNIGEEMINYKEFQEFILSERINFLKVSYLPNSNKVVLSNNENMKQINEKEISINFHKTRNKSIQLETFLDQVDIICSHGSTAKILINELDNNFIPKISNFKQGGSNQKLNSMLSIAESFKDKIINIDKKINYEKIMDSRLTEENYENVLTVEDELEFWKTYAKTGKDQERNNKILTSIAKLEKYFSENQIITNENINEVLTQIIGHAEDILQDVSIIPKINLERLKNFIELALDRAAEKVASFLTTLNFSEYNGTIISKLNEIFRAISSTFERIEYINKLFYGNPNNSNKKLTNNSGAINSLNSDMQFSKVYYILNDLLEIKMLYFEITKLIPDMNINLNLSFLSNYKSNSKCFNLNETNKGTNLIFSSSKQLEEIKILINNDLDKYESDIIKKLNQEIFGNLSGGSSGAQVIATLREMNNWKTLFSRNKILKLTQQSREILFKDFRDYFTQLKTNFESKNQESIEETLQSYEKISNVSEKISEILWAHTIKQKAENSKKLAGFFKDLDGYERMMDLFDNFISLINSFIHENINDWQSEFIEYSTNNNQTGSVGNSSALLPKVGTDLIDINKKTGFLNINFSEKLFKLIQDMRILTEYGYVNKLSTEIQKINDEGKKILKDAISLKQIANFYNTLSSQVITCQKPMLIQCAKDFETSLFLLTERTKINNSKNNNIGNINIISKKAPLATGNNNNSQLDLENFVGLVQNAANDLTKEIRKLKKAHSTILDYISQLLNYDLITNKNKWKEILKKSRNIFFEICDSYKGENEALTQEWSAHWNFQLYKVLKIQYSISLQKYFEYVSEFNCELIIQNRNLSIVPAIEDLKKNLFKELKNFISIPVMIKGFTDDADYYHVLINSNTENIKMLYERANNALEKLESLKGEFSEILGLCSIDFENYIQNNFTKLEDWQFNYEILRKKRKELEKMDDYMKIDCFKINLIPLKSYMDEVFDKIFDILSYTLKEKLGASIKIIDEFVKDAMVKMQKKASNTQEILIFKNNFLELSRKKFEIKKICEEGEKMNELLTRISGQALNVDKQISNLESKIDDLNNIMNSFSDMIEEQKQTVKIELNKKMKNMNNELEKFYAKWTAIKIHDNYAFITENDNNEFEESAKSIKNVYDEWANYEGQINSMIEECKNFEIEVEEIKIFEKIKSEIEQNKSKWSLIFSLTNELEAIYNEDWLSIRFKAYGVIQDHIINWSDKIRKREKDFIYFYIFNKLEKFKQSLNVYKYLIGDNFERDHWKSLFNTLKFDNKITKENLKFGHFIDKTELLVKKAADIKDLYSRAQGEILIRNAISELSAWFETAEFAFTEYININTNRKTPLIKDWKEILNEISEKQALLISVKSSEYFSRFTEQIEQYESKFAKLEIWLQNLNLIQRKWVYLEPIFLRGALPKESARFKKIDDEFRNILLSLNSNLKVQTIFSIMNIKDTLDMLIDQLEKCQKALNDFLEEKRNKFARLYFLGDDDLLEFLAKSKDQQVIKNNLKKLYQGISNLIIIEDYNKGKNNNCEIYIKRMLSAIGEKVELNNKIVIVDELEKWLLDLTNEMRNTLALNLADAMKKYSYSVPVKNLENLNIYSAQICNISEMVGFTALIENAIKNNKLGDLKNLIIEIIEKLSIIQAQTNNSKSNNTDLESSVAGPVKLFKIKNLMLDFIHNKEIIECLIKNKVVELNDWFWFSQLKYFYNPKKNNATNTNNLNNSNCLKISMCDGNFDYTFEYQGSNQKLVHTPLTDKCYLTLTQSLHLGYGGNPYGPAGTGKTESVKALGQAFGRQILVFNCDEGIDFKAMGRIFIGLVKSGAWGCFDEFNRLLEEQLSAISTQIQIIQFGLKQSSKTLVLLNQKVYVDLNAAIFVTLNPAGKGYGGRSKLPDNLKVLFRPVAMSVPDNLQIAQTLLYAEGFKHAEILARKVTALFSLCKQSLSYQQHYDWGLRSLKAILMVANQQIQILLTQSSNESEQGKVTYEDEVDILIKAIRINVLSKLTFEDAKILNLLIQDVFPGINMTDINYEDLNNVLLQVYEEFNFEFIESQYKKVIQFHEALKQRMGVVLVGPGGCGKSAIWRLLKKAYTKLNQEVKVHIINPKSISRSHLLGYMNHDTGEYSYGVLTKCAREVEKENPETKCWMICDGDIDPEWIEALNSVLDDNRLLTMQNGERINFGSNVNFIFESDSLKFASPATISRMGIIYMNKEDLDTKSLVNSWIKKCFSSAALNLKSNIENWFENYFYEIYSLFFEKNNNYNNNNPNISSVSDENLNMLKTTNYGTIQNFLSLCFFNNNAYSNHSGLINNSNSDQNNKNLSNTISVNQETFENFIQSKSHFVNLLIKGLGANLNFENRKKLALEVYQISGEKPPNSYNPLNNYYDKKQNLIKEYEIKQDIIDINLFNSQKTCPLIKTTSVMNYLEIIRKWLDANEPFIIIGPEGSGKNLLVNNSISELKSCNISVINCTSQTTSTNIIQKLQQICTYKNTSKGRALRPKDCQKIILFLKDINLPKPDKYNTIQLISFLHQVVAYQGFYDENLEFIFLERIQIIASMNPSSTLGRYEITTRLTGNVRILFVDYPTNEELSLIYENYFTAVVNNYIKINSENYQNLNEKKNTTNNVENQNNDGLNINNIIIKKIVYSIVEFYNEIKITFKFDEQRHYLFTPRDITMFLINLIRYEVKDNSRFLEIIGYEIIRVFKDRLVTKENLNKFDKIVYNLLKKLASFLNVNVNISTNSDPGSSNNANSNIAKEKPETKNLLMEIIKNKKIFTAINSNKSNILANTNNLVAITKEEYMEYLEKGKMVYERDNIDLYLNYFEENLIYFKIIDRLISKTESNLLLVGSNSIGRKKSLKLISTCLQYDIITPNFSRDFGIKDFKKLIKEIFQITGVEGRSVVFLIEEHQIIRKEILEMINSLLCSGEIPGLLNHEDIEGLISNITNEYKEQNEYKNLYEFFVSRVRKYLKIILVLDYDNKEFNNTISNNPALITKCSIVWFQNLSKDTLKALAREILKDCREKLSNLKNEELSSNKSGVPGSKDLNVFDKIIKILIEIFYSVSSSEGNLNNDEQNNQEKVNIPHNNMNKSEKIISTHGKFIEFLLSFKKIFFDKISNSSSTKDHLKSGLNKLIDAEKFVEELSLKSKQQNIEIEKKKAEANDSLQKITEAMTLAANKRTQLEKLSKEIYEDSKTVEENKEKVECELKDVLPEVEKARQLVKKLDSSKLTELRAYFRQPILKPEVYLVLKAMLQLIGYSDLTSEGVKSTFGAETISTLANFEIRKLTKENFRKVLMIINDNPSYFDRNNVQRINFALAQIAEYVNAVVKFFRAKENIRPLEQALEDAEAKLAVSQKKLEMNSKDLAKMDHQIKEFQENFAKKTGETEVLKIEYQKTEELITKAKNLLMKLSNEKFRWQNQQNELVIQNQMLPYNSCLAASFVTFMGYYNEAVRETYVKIWTDVIKENIKNEINIKINNDNICNSLLPLTKFMLTESEALKFKSQGLPFDNLSLENAIAIQSSLKTALIIDPNSKAIEWFKKFIVDDNSNINTKNKNNPNSQQAFDIISMQDSKLLTSIELAIRFGKIILIEDVDCIEPFLVPIIRKESFKQGPRNVMKIGDKIVDIQEKFKIYLSTRDSQMEISPNIFSSLTVVNFTVTKSGLESLLLGLTIDIEKPELERKKNELLELQDKIKIELADVEKKLLDELINLEGNLLENKELINSLEQSKEKSIKSEESLKNSLELSKEIDIKRNIYKPLSQLATVIYMLLQDIKKINPMYRFSLNDFVVLYRKTLKIVQQKFKNNEKEINFIKLFMCDVIKESYYYFSRSILKNDLLLFSMFFVKSIFYDNVHIFSDENETKNFYHENQHDFDTSNDYNSKNKLEWDFLIGNNGNIDGNVEVPELTWLNEERRAIYINFCKSFPDLAQRFNFSSDKIWQKVYKSEFPEKEIDNLEKNKIIDLNINSNKNNSLNNSKIIKLILIQVFRPDRLETAIKLFLCDFIEINTLTQNTIGMNKLIEEVEELKTNEKTLTPILFITTLGSDPSKELEDFAQREVGIQNYIEIPMGAGDNDKILINLREASQKGYWICLKNLHLSVSWLPNLEKEIKNLKETHPRFKIFLTSESHVKFSTVLLQMSKKIAYETPPGVKKNLERIYQIWQSNNPIVQAEKNENQKMDLCSNALNKLKFQALFALAFIHALLQERRTYIPQGWTKFYEFSYADLKVSTENLINYLDNSDERSLPNIWKNIKGLIINSFYGGRIDNEFDFEIMRTYIEKILDLNMICDTSQKILNKIPIINTSDFTSYLTLIDKFSDSDDPSLFLLPSNVDRSVQRYVSNQTLTRLNGIYSLNINSNSSDSSSVGNNNDSSSIKFDKNITKERLNPLLQFWKSQYNTEQADMISRLSFKIYSDDPINLFIKAQALQIFDLGKIINKTLNDISNVLEFNYAITSGILNDCLCLMQNKIPEIWSNCWDGPELPFNYLKALMKKLSAMSGYLKNVIDETLLNNSINLSEFLHPEAFLNALRQKSARINKIPIDEMEIYASFDEERKYTKNNIFAKITGLFIQGCEFDGVNLSKINENSLEIISLPTMYLYWVDIKRYEDIIKNIGSVDLLEIPMYENNFREKYICKFNLPIKENKSEAILKGIAICLDSI